MDDGATPVAIRLRRSIAEHDAYTVRLADHRLAVLATARPSDARRWVATTRWLHHPLLFHGRLVVGLGVQWTPPRRPLGGAPPVPSTLQLCVGHRCLVFHLAQAHAVPGALRRFLADPRVTFVGAGSAHDRRMLRAHCGIRVARGLELRAVAGMGNASMEEMADRILGYPGVAKPRDVSMSAWHAPRLDVDQVLYAAVDAFLAFRLGVHLCPGGAAALHHHQPPPPRPAPPAHIRPLILNTPLPLGPRVVHPAPPTPAQRASRPAPPAQRVDRPRASPPVQRAAPVYVPLRQAPSPTAAQATGAIINNAATPRLQCSPRAFRGRMAILPPAQVDRTSKDVNTGSGLLASDTDAETDYDDDAGDSDTATHDGLPVRAYASDSDDGDYSSDGFQLVRFGAFTDDDEEDEDDADLHVNEERVCSGLGTLSVDDHEEDEYAEIGILTVDDSTRDDEFNGKGEDGAGNNASEYLGDNEAVLDGGEDALGQDDWNDQEGCGCDDLDGDDDLFEEFCFL